MKLNQSEMKLMELIWEHEPVGSGELVALSEKRMGWKKSTMYTVLSHLVKKGAAANRESVVTSLRDRDSTLSERSENIVGADFGGSLPMFLTAFFGGRKLSAAEAEELKALIDSYTEDKA
ncbi:MAG: BlaI/MecI/CopY family transcriptional regulator [Oscillospiraceae bacterium]|nr:BlaI/MecI/CopY family transcriptional regulator [Oscillospiraceae bacterium]